MENTSVNTVNEEAQIIDDGPQPQPPLQEPQISVTPDKRNILPFILLALAVIILGISGFFGYKYFFKDPLALVLTSFSNLEKSESFSVSFVSADDSVNLSGDIQKNGTDASKIDFSSKFIDEEIPSEVAAHIIVNSKDLFLSFYYNRMQEIEDQMAAYLPNILTTQTYFLTKPFLLDKKWLNVNFESLGSLSSSDTLEEPTSLKTTTDEDTKMLQDGLKGVLIFKKYDRVYVLDKQIYRRIVFGINKEKFIEFLESIKDTNIDVKLSQLNSIIDVVKSVDNWDSELAEVLIDSEGNLAQITLSIPEISEEALTGGLNSQIEDRGSTGLGTRAYLGQAFTMLGSFIKSKEKVGGITKIGTIKFYNYNKAPIAELPRDYISFNEIMNAAKIEIIPMFAQMVTGQQGTPSPSPALPYQPKSALEYSQMMEAQKRLAPTPNLQ